MHINTLTILNEGIISLVRVVRRLAGTVHPQNKSDCTLVI